VGADRLKQLFDEARSLPEQQKAEFLAAIRSKDPPLADELFTLLVAHTNAGLFLTETPPSKIVRNLEIQNSIIGPYRLIRLLAWGGMGDVYEAVREGGKSDERVALKVMRLGAMTPELVRRFNLERRMIARLDHPNIARLLDGGTTPDGIPYLAMEYVEGKRIDEYCNSHQCSIEQRLKIFLSVCAAVQYAHGRLVVHRDIKPNNILVTDDGVPKLLDFGIAKLLSSDTTPVPADETRTSTRIFTPEYASPEQINGEEITTASDVYSLGVLLYVVLTGSRPYDLAGTKQQDYSTAIQRQEPLKPSGRTITIQCQEGADRTKKRLRGELDTIVLTALEKNPQRRYISVEQFAEDIRRHLSHLPIQARPGPLGQRFSKFVRRNRYMVAGTGIILLGLVAWLSIALYQVRQARTEKARVESISAFLEQMVTFTNPNRQVPGGSRTATVMQDVLDDAANRLESDEFASQPSVRVQLERILGEAYDRQGRYDLMYKHFHRYLELCEEQPALHAADLLDARSLFATELFAKGQLNQADSIFRLTIPPMRVAADNGELKPEILAQALNNFAYLRRTQGDSRDAESLFRDVLALGPRFSKDSRFVLSVTRSTLASVLADQGRFAEALQTAGEAAAESRREGIAATPPYGFVLTIYGGFLTEAGRYSEADSALAEARSIFRQLLQETSLWTGDNFRNQAALLYCQGKYPQALEKVQGAINNYLKAFGTHYDTYPTALSIKGLTLSHLGQPAEAEKALREAVDLRRELMPPGHFFTGLALGALGEFLTSQGRYTEAESLLVESYSNLLKSQGPTNPRTLMAKGRLHDLYVAWKKPQEAARYQH
jgi:eukaryotic-like serine/threonine-protein kinase